MDLLNKLSYNCKSPGEFEKQPEVSIDTLLLPAQQFFQLFYWDVRMRWKALIMGDGIDPVKWFESA